MVVGRSAAVGKEGGERTGGRGLFLGQMCCASQKCMRHHVQLAYVAGLCSRNEPCCQSEGRAGALQGHVSLHNFFP